MWNAKFNRFNVKWKPLGNSCCIFQWTMAIPVHIIQHEREEEGGHHHFTHMVGHCLNIETDKNVKMLLKKKKYK